jgi:hypothetical protein
VGNRGNRGTASKYAACSRSPLLSVGEQGNTNMFLNISVSVFLFGYHCSPQKRGEQIPSESPGNIGCSHCSPVPPFFFTDTFGQWSKSGEVKP